MWMQQLFPDLTSVSNLTFSRKGYTTYLTKIEKSPCLHYNISSHTLKRHLLTLEQLFLW